MRAPPPRVPALTRAGHRRNSYRGGLPGVKRAGRSRINLFPALWHDRRARALHDRSPARLRRHHAPAVPAWEARRAARWNLVRGQGSLRRGGASDRRGQPRLGAHSPDSHRDGAGRAAAARRRRDPRRQVVHRRARFQPRRHQHPLRHAGQSSLPRSPARRLVQRIGLRRHGGTRRLRPRHRHARMLARAGQVLLQSSETAHDFNTLAVLTDAFDMVDQRYVHELRAKVACIEGAFKVTREVRLGNLESWLETFRTLKQSEAWQAHGDWIRSAHPRFAPNIEASFQSASTISDAARRRALDERARLLELLRAHVSADTVLCLPSAWTIAPLKTASAEELATNRVKDLTLGSVASLAGVPQVSVPVVGERYAIGLGLLAAAGSDARLLALAKSLPS